MNIEQIKEEWAKDAQFDQTDIPLESLMTSSLHAKYINEITHHKLKVLKYDNDYAVAKKLKTRYYSGLMGKDELEEYGFEQYNGKKLLKDDMATYIAGDEDMIVLQQRLEYEKIAIYLLEGIVKNLYNRNWEIGNYNAAKKFDAGY